MQARALAAPTPCSLLPSHFIHSKFMFLPRQDLEDPDAGIRSTDTDASLARLSAVKKGYLKDPYVHHLVPRPQFQQPRTPLINVGTAIRSESLDRLICSWIRLASRSGKKVQIVSLGAGNDTRFWRLINSGYLELINKYVEVDFPEITSKKALAVIKKKELFGPLGEPIFMGSGGSCLFSSVYNLVSGDLRQPLQAFTQLTDGDTPLLNCSLPTLLLFECVLAYMEPSHSENIMTWFSERMKASAPLGVLVYEMFGLHDRFGQVMKTNLQSAKNILLPGVELFPDKPSLEARFTNMGFLLAKALTLKEIRLTIVPDRGQALLDVERMDEVEELDLVLDHYAITWAQLWPQEREENDQQQLWEAWDLQW